ncbi:MAG: DJ-1/PfpI family protein [Mycobacteriales bacterium]
MSQSVYLYVCDTLSDWEPGHAIAALNQPFGQRDPGSLQVRTIAATADPVRTAGGVRILPDLTVEEAARERPAMLILPGAGTWDQAVHKPVIGFAKSLLDKDIPVAAICGATVALAAAGMLDDRDHTSNDPSMLDGSGYAGAGRYRPAPAVTDRGLITAGAAHPAEFAREILRTLEVYEPDTLENWYGLYTTGERAYFDKFMAAV